jgi:hypothetical protein
MEQIGDMIACFLPTFIRRLRLAVRVKKLYQYTTQLIATYAFWRAVVDKEIALANHYVLECNRTLSFCKNNLSPTSLRAEWENELEVILDQAIADNIRQIQENNQSKCLI